MKLQIIILSIFTMNTYAFSLQATVSVYRKASLLNPPSRSATKPNYGTVRRKRLIEAYEEFEQNNSTK